MTLPVCGHMSIKYSLQTMSAGNVYVFISMWN